MLLETEIGSIRFFDCPVGGKCSAGEDNDGSDRGESRLVAGLQCELQTEVDAAAHLRRRLLLRVHDQRRLWGAWLIIHTAFGRLVGFTTFLNIPLRCMCEIQALALTWIMQRHRKELRGMFWCILVLIPGGASTPQDGEDFLAMSTFAHVHAWVEFLGRLLQTYGRGWGSRIGSIISDDLV